MIVNVNGDNFECKATNFLVSFFYCLTLSLLCVYVNYDESVPLGPTQYPSIQNWTAVHLGFMNADLAHQNTAP